MTSIIAGTKDTSLALVLATTLLSDIPEPCGEGSAQDAADSPPESSSGHDDVEEPSHIDPVPTESLSAITSDVPCTPSANPETVASVSDTSPSAASVPDVSPSATVAAVDLTLNVASASVVTVVDEGDDYTEVQDAIAEGCVLNIYKGVYFNIPASSDAAPPLYYITRGRKIGVFSGWGNVGPKVLGVSRAIFAKVETIDQGMDALMAAIDAGTAARV
ncbi:hypothetical protein EDD22DRAFT_850524 [Suillus occidentalis]|nr:hypothetical protein EDD22DRAFT_853590 [Suillus occidentalis]KAG1753149.1 hypothetical protein EDD22DRAFT_850524 [Suillus occidentalis]